MFGEVTLAVILLTLSVVVAHSAKLLVLETILGAFIIVLVGAMLFLALDETFSGYKVAYNVASMLVIACGGTAYFFYRRQAG